MFLVIIMYVCITFCIFALVNYLYIYSLFDKKVLFTSMGSKLKSISYDNKIRGKPKDWDITNIKTLSIRVIINLVICLFFFFLNYFFANKIFSSNFWNITIFSKQINFSLIFSSYMLKIQAIYYILSFVFFLIISVKITSKLKGLEGYINEITSEDTIDIHLDNKILLGRDEEQRDVYINTSSLTKNVYVTGSIGCGKTTGAMANLTDELVKRGMGGVILDAKGNFVDVVEAICHKYNRQKDLKVISIESKYSFVLLDENVSPLELSSRLRQIIELLSDSKSSEPYWLDKVENVLLNFLVIIDFYGKRDIMVLHKMVSSEEYLLKLIASCKEKAMHTKLSERICFELKNAITFVQEEYLKLDTRVLSIIKSEITRLTIPLITEYDVYNKFGSTASNLQSKYEQVSFNTSPTSKHQIVVLSINIGSNKALCRIIATFLKLNFQKHILSNISNSITTFFIADEYQEFANVQDAHFLSLAREARCINILATQSYTSLKNALKDENATHVIIQNLVNKIWFRNDDVYTVSEVIKQMGKLDVKKENESIAEQARESTKYMFKKGFKNRTSSISKTISYVTSKENEYDENYFTRSLKTFEALAFIPNDQDIMTPQFVKFERWKKEDK